MNLAYLATPYSKYPLGRTAAFLEACGKAAELMEAGEIIFCPIAHSHPIERHGMTHDHDGEFWLRQDFAVLQSCNKMIVYKMDGWEDSEGIARETQFCAEHGIPVEYID